MEKTAIVTDKAPARARSLFCRYQGQGQHSRVRADPHRPLPLASLRLRISRVRLARASPAIKNILEAAGSSMCDIVETTVLLTDIDEFGPMNEVYAEFFSKPYPARAAFQVVAT